jgi:hypothetical protein
MVANPTIQYMLYEWGAQWWRRPSKDKSSVGANLSAIEVFVISAVAKLGATLCTYPLLVVKNRVQVCFILGFLPSTSLQQVIQLSEGLLIKHDDHVSVLCLEHIAVGRSQCVKSSGTAVQMLIGVLYQKTQLLNVIAL